MKYEFHNRFPSTLEQKAGMTKGKESSKTSERVQMKNSLVGESKASLSNYTPDPESSAHLDNVTVKSDI